MAARIVTIGDNACLLPGCGLDSIAMLARQAGHLVLLKQVADFEASGGGEIDALGAT
jgi:hypothetical protein